LALLGNPSRAGKDKMRLRRQITRMMSPVDILQFSQFTIDWLQDLDDADAHGDTTGDEQTDNLALAYEIDTIREVLRYGQDKALFDMLASYAALVGHGWKGER